MKNKILDEAKLLIVIYGLALGFVLIIGMLDYNDPFMIFIILPTSYFIAIYEYSINKTIKQQYKESTSELLIDIANKDKQIKDSNLIDDIRIEKIDKLTKEIIGLKGELKNVPHDSKSYNSLQATLDKSVKKDIPFNKDNDTTEQIWVCPECNGVMTRHTKAIVFCDTPSCTRKQWKKEKL